MWTARLARDFRVVAERKVKRSLDGIQGVDG